MKYMVRRFSFNKAIELQETAETTTQAKRRFENSCNLCCARNCTTCSVKNKHEECMVYLEAKEREALQPKRPIIWETTREYHISPLNQMIRSAQQMASAIKRHMIEYSSEEYTTVSIYVSFLKMRDFQTLKNMMVKDGYWRKGRQKVTAISPFIDKCKEIIKEVF